VRAWHVARSYAGGPGTGTGSGAATKTNSSISLQHPRRHRIPAREPGTHSGSRFRHPHRHRRVSLRLATPVRGRSHKTKCAGGEGAGRGEWGSAFVIEPIFDLFCSVLEPIVLGVRSFLFCFVVLLFFCGGLIPPHFGGITSPQFWGDNPPAFWGIIPHNPH
jgi:hypothetical protein